MNQNKICPDCGNDYLPHVRKCADCGSVLLLPEEHRKALEERRRAEEKAVENSVVVRDGDLDWLTELRSVLIDAGIPCAIHFDSGCKKGCCGDKCLLLVSSEDLERAQESIEEHLMEMDPEFRTSKELIEEGKCPACGSYVGKDELDCPDCERPLLIIGEDEEEEG